MNKEITDISNEVIKRLINYPFKNGKSIFDEITNKWYYYHELIKMGYTTMMLSEIKRNYNYE